MSKNGEKSTNVYHSRTVWYTVTMINPNKCLTPGCNRTAVANDHYCRRHTMLEVKGVKYGVYSTRLPATMQKIFNAMDNEDELTLIEELKLLRTLLLEKLEALDTVADTERFVEIISQAGRAKAYLNEITVSLDDKYAYDKLVDCLNQIEDQSIREKDKEAVKKDVRQLLTEVRDMARTESAIRYNKQTSISQREVQSLMAALLTILVKNIGDANVLEAIRWDIARIFNRGLSNGTEPREQGQLEGAVGRPSDQNQEPGTDKADSERDSAGVPNPDRV